MSDTSKSPSVQVSEEEQSLQALKKYAQWVILAVAAVMLAVTLVQNLRSRREAASLEQFLALSQAFTSEGLADVQTAFPEKPAGLLATFQLAAMRFRDGEYAEALSQYDLFLAEAPEHPLSEGARFGRFMALEELGNLDEALQGFRSFDASAVLYPQALFGQARILEKQGDLNAAIAVYEEIEAAFEDEVWAFQAEEFRKAAQLQSRNGNG